MTASWATYLQRFRTPWLDTLAYFITCLGSEWFFMIALPLLYWTWNKRAAYRVAAIFLFGDWTKNALKAAFRVPRPEPGAGTVVLHPETAPGYSFPSGHAESSTVFWGQIAVEARKRWVWAVAAVVTLLVCWSRLYLNVHWPVDILGGVVLGVVLLVIWNAACAVWARLDPPFWARVLCIMALPAVMYLVYSGEDSRVVIGFILGFPMGRLLEERYLGWNERATLPVNLLKLAVGFGGLMAVRFGLKPVFPETVAFDLARYALAGFWASFGAPLVFAGLGWQD